MAIMINCGRDWTYDLFLEDAGRYRATPMRGVHCSANATDREQFMVWFKNSVRDFKAKWEKDGRKAYDRFYGYIGDAFAATMLNGIFSDVYKDTYGQRPHLPVWFYVHAIGLPMSEDTARTFCATPVEDAIKEAKHERQMCRRWGL